MMIGEFDFDNIFNSTEHTVPGVTWFIFVVFLIIMTLILMNLLVRFMMTFVSLALNIYTACAECTTTTTTTTFYI